MGIANLKNANYEAGSCKFGFPRLSFMACDNLSILISRVALELAFKVGEYVLKVSEYVLGQYHRYI